MKIAVIGAVGNMGQCICHMIKRFGTHEIHTWDRVNYNENANKLYSEKHTRCNVKDLSDIGRGFDVVISSLPYYLNDSIAEQCITKGMPYFDLGGSVKVRKKINTRAKQKKAIVFTDLGLAPGLVNILSEEALSVNSEVPHTINMRCGGIPENVSESDKDPFNYKLTWSSEGLYNEYTDMSLILKDGNIITVPSLTEREIVEVASFPHLEAFTTSGGASHTLQNMQQRGVKNCSYKTLRYKGHLDLMLYFLHEKKYNADQIADLFPDFHCKDVVIVEVEAFWKNLIYRKTKVIHSKDGFSAMQRATAGGLVSTIFASPIDKSKAPLTYVDVNIMQFNKNMKALDIY